jgi:glucose/mannose-6-phosphate isomerase
LLVTDKYSTIDIMNNPQDPSNFRQMLLESPDQFNTGFSLAKDIKVPGEFQKIVISGMGGSALPADLLKIYLQDLLSRNGKKSIEIYQNRYYTLPEESYNNALNLMCSYSGNTEETIASFQEALDHNLPCIGISSGGKIEAICKEKNIPHVKLPVPFPNFQPRIGTGYFFSVLLQILINQKMIPDTTSEILASAEELKKEIARFENQGMALAKKLKGKTPVIYSSVTYQAIAMIWKIMFNENSKTPAFWNFFPELNHNEMIGYTKPQGKFFVLMLRDPSDHQRNKNRFEATAQILGKQNTEVEILDLEGEKVFSKIFYSLMLGVFTSYYLSLEYDQDPTPVKTVEELKSMLAKM